MVPFIDLRRQYQSIKEEIFSVIKEVFKKAQFILGEEVLAFEEEFSRYCGVQYGVGVGSGTDALYLALKAIGIGEGDEVITVSHSFIATALAISFTGAKPIFVDIDSETYTMDPNALETLLKRRRSKKIKAILPVHLYGHPADMDSIIGIAKQYDLPIIEDACQAHGAKYKGKRVGTYGVMGCFSFYPTKNLGGYGDGGMVITSSKELYKKLCLLRNYGERKKYYHVLMGKNSRLDELQAAVLRVKLKYLDQWNEERRRKAHIYKQELEGAEVICPVEKEGSDHVYNLFVIRTKRREALKDFLKMKGVNTLIHYPVPIHHQKVFKTLRAQERNLPVTEKISREVLSLPLFPEITNSELEEVCQHIHSFNISQT